MLKSGKDRYWRPIGAVWPHADGDGFRVKLNFLPLDPNADLVIRKPIEEKDSATAVPEIASAYRHLLNEQQAIRGELRWRQDLGLDNAAFLTEAGNLNVGEAITRGFREAANEVTKAPTGGEYRTTAKTNTSLPGNDRSAEHGRSGDHIGGAHPQR